MLMTRRGLIGGLASLVAAPAIVRASSLMPVKTLPWEPRPYQAQIWRALGGFGIDLRPGALNYAKPYPGWRLRFDPSGIVFHEPDPGAAKAA